MGFTDEEQEQDGIKVSEFDGGRSGGEMRPILGVEVEKKEAEEGEEVASDEKRFGGGREGDEMVDG